MRITNMEIESTQEQAATSEESSDKNEIDNNIDPAGSKESSIEISDANSDIEKESSSPENSQINIQETIEDTTFTTIIRKKRKHIEPKPYKTINKEKQYEESGQRTRSNSKNQ